MTYTLARPDSRAYAGPPVKGFLTGMMLLAGMILLAACANLGSLFAARAADRARDGAAAGAGVDSQAYSAGSVYGGGVDLAVGGRCGLSAACVLRRLSAGSRSPVSDACACIPGRASVCVALAVGVGQWVSLWSGARTTDSAHQSLRGCESRIGGMLGRRITLRDMLLVVQIAICAVLVTSSLVAVRGLVRSLHSNFGFEPQNGMLVNTDCAWPDTAAIRCRPCRGA